MLTFTGTVSEKRVMTSGEFSVRNWVFIWRPGETRVPARWMMFTPPLNVPYHRLRAGNYLPHRENDYITTMCNSDVNLRAVVAPLPGQWLVLGVSGFGYRQETLCCGWYVWFLSLSSDRCLIVHQRRTQRLLVHPLLFVIDWLSNSLTPYGLRYWQRLYLNRT
jgi:hypothetical protein